jgi:uncharacterized protein (DUF433 family)
MTRETAIREAAQEYVETDPQKLGGVPIFKGTRFAVRQLFAELADGQSVQQIAKNYRLDLPMLRGFLHSLGIALEPT